MSIDKRVNYEVQGGVKNYQPSKMVTVPEIAKSSPDTPTAKLAYITPEEQDILIDLNLYGSLKGKPNRGPGGIPSLEGDFESYTSGMGGSYDEAGLDVAGSAADQSTYDAPTGAVDDKFKGSGQSPDYFTTTNTTGYDEQTGVNTPPRNTGHDGGRDNNDLQTLYNQGVSTINTPFNLPTPLTAGLNVLTPLRNFGLRKNIDYFRNEVLKNKNRGGYTDTLESYKKYMQNRLAGKTDAHGNPMRGFEDGNDGIMNIPLETIGGNLSETIGGNLLDDTEEGEFVSRFLQNQPDDIREEIEARMQNYYTV